MSINVTVTGNPVCVRRGKMVTTTTSGGEPRDVVDEEFDRRRLLRLEQVRQQSRDIAEGVRQKVRKEKRRQLGELEREGKEELRRSQNRRLLELQTQYREGLRELGAGHREAEKENDMERQLARRRESEQRDAARRGNEAAAALLRPTEKEPTEPKQKRPQPVVKTHKKKKKKVVAPTTTTTTTRHVSKKRRGATADINITVPGTDTDDEATEATEASSSKTEEASTSDVESSSGASPRRPPEATPIERRSGPCLSPVEECPSNTPRVSDDRQPSSPAKTSLERFLRDLAGPPDLPEPDTRISERIRRRSLVPPEPEPERPVPDKRRCSCGKFSRITSNRLPTDQPTKDIREPQRCHCELRSASVQVDEEKAVPVVPPDGSRDKLRSRSVQVEKEESTVESELNRRRCPCDKPVEMRSRSVQVEEERMDLPQLPEVDVRTSSETFKSGSGASKVQFYDHASRTRTERRVPIDSYLERNITPAPHVQSESLPRDNPSDCCEEAKRRRDARARFRNALERDRISKDYEEMLRRLPLLERRERVAGIGGDRQEHHMAERRAKEVERRRQNAMENEYAQTFRRPVVTVPRRRAEGPAGWDEERPPAREESLGEPKIFTANEVQEIVKAFTGRNVDERRRKLRELLESLKLQKEELVKEIRKIPADDSVNELIRDLDSVIVEGDRDKDGKKRSRRRRRRSTGDSSTSSSSSSELRTKGRKERKRDTSKVVRTISTQTSDDRTVCTELHVPCDCKPELCEIVIQVRDDEKVKVSGPQDEEEKQPADDVIPEKRSVAVGTDSIPPVRSTSHGRWRDSLVRNSFSTTSTSYRSPPDFRKFTGRCGGTKTNLSSLVPIVERLLSMSRTSVDELSVSTASSVATPSRSVVDVAANHPERDRLEEVVRYFAARTAEVPHALSVSPDVPYVPPNTTDTSRAPSADSRESLMRQYAEITESCSRRIQNLTDMIRRLRDEKDEMLCKAQCDGTTNNNTSSSVDEDELYRKITEIDMELAAKLKGMKESNRDAVDTMKRLTDPDSSNVEMIARLERLRDPPTSTSAFVPFLSDVPKLPKFEPIPPPNNNDGNLQHRRPPPSKGLDRLTDEPLVPHELSTIAEADSQALPDIPEEEEQRPPPKESAPTTASDTLEDVLRDMGMAWAIPTVAKTKEAAAMTSSSSSKSERFASLLTDSSSGGGSSEMSNIAQAQTSAQAPPRTSTPLTSDKSPSMAFSDSSSISFVKRSSNDS